MILVVTGLSFARSSFWELVNGAIFTTAPVTQRGALAQVMVVKDEGDEGEVVVCPTCKGNKSVDDFFHIYFCYYRTNLHQLLMRSTKVFPNCCFIA